MFIKYKSSMYRFIEKESSGGKKFGRIGAPRI